MAVRGELITVQAQLHVDPSVKQVLTFPIQEHLYKDHRHIDSVDTIHLGSPGLHSSPLKATRMRKPWFARAAVIGGIVVATIVGSTGPAMAANLTLTLSGHGKMTYIDDGDVFQICDTAADGHGVFGELYYRPYLGDQRLVLELNDGGDAGCDKKGHNVGNGGTYQMLLCWYGNVFRCVWSNEFNE